MSNHGMADERSRKKNLIRYTSTNRQLRTRQEWNAEDYFSAWSNTLYPPDTAVKEMAPTYTVGVPTLT